MWQRVYKRLADPEFAQKIHGWFTVVWFLASIPLALAFGTLVIFVSWLSLYAIVVSHWSSWQATRTEVAQDRNDKAIKEALDRIREIDRNAPFTPDN